MRDCEATHRALEGLGLLNYTKSGVAERLGESLLFLSLGTAEGCPLPPLEAMASGCVVAGYHGQGGREYFHPRFSRPVEAGDVLALARAVEDLLLKERASPGTVAAMGRQAAAFVREQYSPQREEQDILGAWRALLGGDVGPYSLR